MRGRGPINRVENGKVITDMPIFIVVKWYNYIGPSFFEDNKRQMKWIPMSASNFISDDYNTIGRNTRFDCHMSRTIRKSQG